MAESGKWFIVHVYNDEEDVLQVQALCEISEDRRAELKNTQKNVLTFIASQNVIRAMIANRNELIESIVLTPKMVLDRSGNPKKIMELGIFNMSRQFANMCSMFRSFLDHSNRYIIGRFGRKSAEQVEFDDARKAELNTCASYCIVYLIRNYIQHYDMPPLAISITENAHEEGVSMRLDLKLNELIKDDSFRKEFTGKFSISEEKLPLFTILEKWHTSVCRIIEIVNNFRLRDVKSSAESNYPGL